MSTSNNSSSDSETYVDTDNSQNDSDTYFISRYVLKDQNKDDVASATADDEDKTNDGSLPYEGEPIADDVWLANYREQKRKQDERRKEMEGRLKQPDSVHMWCKCGNCSTDLLQNSKGAQCCMEIDGCVEAINSDQVLSEVDSPPSCVTFHPGFNPVCLETWSLRQAGRKYRKINGSTYHKSDSENRYLRAVSYREFTYLVYGYLGQRRYPLPACAYHAIRKKFSDEKDSTYTGYDDEQLEIE